MMQALDGHLLKTGSENLQLNILRLLASYGGANLMAFAKTNVTFANRVSPQARQTIFAAIKVT